VGLAAVPKRPHYLQYYMRKNSYLIEDTIFMRCTAIAMDMLYGSPDHHAGGVTG
jgi:hypothetical protein